MKKILLFAVAAFVMTMFYGCPGNEDKDPGMATGTMSAYAIMMIDGEEVDEDLIDIDIQAVGDQYQLTFGLFIDGGPVEFAFPIQSRYVRNAVMTYIENDFMEEEEMGGTTRLTGHALSVGNTTTGNASWSFAMEGLNFFSISNRPYSGVWGTMAYDGEKEEGAFMILDGTVTYKPQNMTGRMTIILIPEAFGNEDYAPAMLKASRSASATASRIATMDIRLK